MYVEKLRDVELYLAIFLVFVNIQGRCFERGYEVAWYQLAHDFSKIPFAMTHFFFFFQNAMEDRSDLCVLLARRNISKCSTLSGARAQAVQKSKTALVWNSKSKVRGAIRGRWSMRNDGIARRIYGMKKKKKNTFVFKSWTISFWRGFVIWQCNSKNVTNQIYFSTASRQKNFFLSVVVVDTRPNFDRNQVVVSRMRNETLMCKQKRTNPK